MKTPAHLDRVVSEHASVTSASWIATVRSRAPRDDREGSGGPCSAAATDLRRTGWARAGGVLALGALLFAFAGCTSTYRPPLDDAVNYGPFYTPVNVSASVLPAEVRRVLVLPVHAGAVTTPEQALRLDEIFAASLQRQQRFEVVTVSRDECRRLFGAPEFSSAAALPPAFLDRLAARHAVDAVLFVDLTAYQAYQPQGLGLRAKLATVRDVRLVWSFDEFISSGDAAVRNSARRRYYATEHGTRPFDLSPAVLQSPGWFAAFAADEMFATLPPR